MWVDTWQLVNLFIPVKNQNRREGGNSGKSVLESTQEELFAPEFYLPEGR